MSIAAPMKQYQGLTQPKKPKPIAKPLKARALPKKRKTLADK